LFHYIKATVEQEDQEQQVADSNSDSSHTCTTHHYYERKGSQEQRLWNSVIGFAYSTTSVPVHLGYGIAVLTTQDGGRLNMVMQFIIPWWPLLSPCWHLKTFHNTEPWKSLQVVVSFTSILIHVTVEAFCTALFPRLNFGCQSVVLPLWKWYCT